MLTQPDVNCFWEGEGLGEIELVCLLSMLRQGHRVRLFSYCKLNDLPAGIESADAREIMPQEDMIRHRERNSPALGTDRFRILLMQKDLGLWLDTDIVLIRPIRIGRDDYLFGWEDDAHINGAVLYLPKDSPIAKDMGAFVGLKYPIPEFYDAKARHYLLERTQSGAPVSVEDMPWGVYGPKALTHFARKHGVARFARPREVFYPVHWSQAHALISASYNISDAVTRSTIAIHLWNAILREPSNIRPNNPKGVLAIEKDSFVEKFARLELGLKLKTVGAL